MTDMPVREIALDALMEILEEGRFCHIVIGRTLDKYAYLDRQDRAFLKRLVEGTVEYRLQEDSECLYIRYSIWTGCRIPPPAMRR